MMKAGDGLRKVYEALSYLASFESFRQREAASARFKFTA